MDGNSENRHTRKARWGWAILLLVSALLVLNGAAWFFTGPSLSWVESMGVSLAEFRQAYPIIADNMARNARQVALWFMSFGLLALLVALEGYRNGSRWAWNGSWIMIAVLVAIGVLYWSGFGIVMFGLAFIVLVGQVLARTGSS